MTWNDDRTTRQASYGLRKLRGKRPRHKPGRTRRYRVLPDAARTIAALLALRDHVIAPILAGIRGPPHRRKPKTWATVDCGYENLGIGRQTLFLHVGIAARPQPQGNGVSIGETHPGWPAVIVLRHAAQDAGSFRGGPDRKIASGLLSGAFCVRRFRAAVVTGGSAARIPVG